MTYAKSLYVNEDRIGSDGKWLRSWHEVVDGQSCQIHSRAERSWRGIENRCKPGGYVQRKRPSYIGCLNGFPSFDDFASWCHEEPGYQMMLREGFQVHLDKDLIRPGNKIYSAETCCFIPPNINTLMLFPARREQSSLPIGCYFHKKNGRYSSYMNDGNGRTRTLGYFDSPMEAHAKWQVEKAAAIRRAALGMPECMHRAHQALDRIAATLEMNAANKKESTF